MLDEYLNRPVKVKLVTGDILPEGVRFYGISSFAPEMLWFVIPRPANPLETEHEYHVPITSIASLEIKK